MLRPDALAVALALALVLIRMELAVAVKAARAAGVCHHFPSLSELLWQPALTLARSLHAHLRVTRHTYTYTYT